MSTKVLSNVFTVPKGSRVVPDKFDVRVVNKNLALGRVTREEVKKHLSELPDESAHCETLNYQDLIDGKISSVDDADKEAMAESSINGGSFR